MAKMETPRLQWSGAQVRDGILTVEIAGDRPKGWKPTFEQTVRLLGGGSWGEVKLKGDTIRVTGVGEGSEDSLRHFLESVIQEANATNVADSDADDRAERAPEGDDADARMTERFRDFDAA